MGKGGTLRVFKGSGRGVCVARFRSTTLAALYPKVCISRQSPTYVCGLWQTAGILPTGRLVVSPAFRVFS